MERRTKLGCLIRSVVLAVSVLLLGFLVGVGAATLARRAGLTAPETSAPAEEPREERADASTATPVTADESSYAPPVVSYTTWDPEEAPNYYRVIGPAVVGTAPAAGECSYGALDALGRATGVASLITYDSMMAGRERSRDDLSALEPSGWGHNAEVDIAMPDGSVYHGQLFNRSHLVAKSLGGDDGLHNLVTATRTQNVGANVDGTEGGMAYAEGEVRSWLGSHRDGTVYYAATPAYEGNELVARSIIVDVRSSDGSIDQRIEVYNAALGFAVDYATGTFDVTGDAAQLAQGLRSAVPRDADDASDESAPVVEDTAQGEVQLTGSQEPENGERKVIITGSGKAYHHDESCKGLENARSMEWVTVSEAERMGRHACGICGG